MSGIEQTGSGKAQTYYNLQYLRFVAASLVILGHAFSEVPRVGRGDLLKSFSFGISGVDIFFVISGFLMCLITQNREKTAGDFLYHRFMRVAPPYWLLTIAAALILVVAPHAFYSTSFVPAHFIASLFFIGWPHPIEGCWPFLAIGWTLNYEFFFYVLFSLTLVLPLAQRIGACSGVFIVLTMLGIFLPVKNVVYQFYTNPIMLEFSLGMIIAWLSSRDAGIGPRLSAGLLAASLFGFAAAATLPPSSAHESSPHVLIFGLPACLLVAGAIGLEKRIPRQEFLRLLGDASYSTYLTHMFVLGLLTAVWKKFALAHHASDVFLILAAFIFAWLAGVFFHLIVEKPLTKFLKNLWPGQRALNHGSR